MPDALNVRFGRQSGHEVDVCGNVCFLCLHANSNAITFAQYRAGKLQNVMAVTEGPSLILARALEKRKPVHGLILREMAMIKEAAGKNDMSKRILVVDDQPDNRQIIRDMLAPTDYEI